LLFALAAASLIVGGTFSAIAAVPATAPAKPAAGASTPESDLLASKGLNKTGPIYLLRSDKEVADQMKAIAQARRKMDEEAKARAGFEQKIKMAKNAYAQYEFERRGHMARLEKAGDPTIQNQIIAKINGCTDNMKEAEKFKEEQEDKLNKIGEEARTKYINLILDTSAAVEKTSKEYETLAADGT